MAKHFGVRITTNNRVARDRCSMILPVLLRGHAARKAWQYRGHSCFFGAIHTGAEGVKCTAKKIVNTFPLKVVLVLEVSIASRKALSTPDI